MPKQNQDTIQKIIMIAMKLEYSIKLANLLGNNHNLEHHIVFSSKLGSINISIIHKKLSKNKRMNVLYHINEVS